MTTDQIFGAVTLALGFVLVCRLFRCAHAWELVDKTQFKSPVEALKESGVTFKEVTAPSEWWTRMSSPGAVILVIRCPKCGAAKVIRETPNK